MLALDLGVFHRKSNEINVKEALVWTCVWVFLAFLFNIFVYYQLSSCEKAFEISTGYLIEKSLSVDNIFVIILIFHFNVPSSYQHKVLFWGILGALILRVASIPAGRT
ncbi:MAG: hypothetical protein U5K54_18420 [Cytophagales bacterium]|nr:hypothetical protein [Cytophagales bacterium]